MIRIVEARYLSGYMIWLRFSDGLTGEVDLEAELDGEVFEPLRDQAFFRSFVLHPELHTIVWPNGQTSPPNSFTNKFRCASNNSIQPPAQGVLRL